MESEEMQTKEEAGGKERGRGERGEGRRRESQLEKIENFGNGSFQKSRSGYLASIQKRKKR